MLTRNLAYRLATILERFTTLLHTLTFHNVELVQALIRYHDTGEWEYLWSGWRYF